MILGIWIGWKSDFFGRGFRKEEREDAIDQLHQIEGSLQPFPYCSTIQDGNDSTIPSTFVWVSRRSST